jgi:hypothetical protein
MSVLAVLAFAGACASAPRVDLGGYVSALEGAYDNSAQYAGAPADLKRDPAAGFPYEWLDQQYGVFKRVEAPALGQHVMYVEWRKGGPEGAISRQRIWFFRVDESGAPRMDYFAFHKPEAFAGKADLAGAFAQLTVQDLKGYGPACALHLTPRGRGAWNGRIEPHECQITANSGRQMGLDVRLTIMPTGVLYSEAGVLPDESFAFKVPGGPPYDLRRRP